MTQRAVVLHGDAEYGSEQSCVPLTTSSPHRSLSRWTTGHRP